MIGARRLGQLRELAVVPVELAAIDDDAADAVAMAAHELRQRVHHDVGAVIDRPAHVGRRESVVDHQRNAVLVRDLGHRFDVEHVAARIADRLAVEALRLRRDGLAEILRIVRLDELHVVARACGS